MITAEEQKMSLQNTIEKHSVQLNQNGDPTWLKDIRKNSAARFVSLGIPTTKNEEWKYTNLAALASHSFKLATKSETDLSESLKDICKKEDLTFVFVNGELDEKLSNTKNLPNGISFSNLNNAFKEKEAKLKTLFSNFSETNNSFVALNQSLTTNGLYLEVADKATAAQFIHIIHVTQNSDAALTTPRTIIVVGKSSEATVLETHVAFDQSVYLSAPLTDIFLGEDSTLHYTKAQSESLKAYHIGNTRVWQERSSHFDGFSLMNGGAITRNDLDIISNGEGTSSTLNGFYGTNGKQLVDNHSSMDHRFPNCTSNQLYKGILNGESHAVFNGKIFVKSVAQKTNSYQLNKNLILGTDCRVDTKPQLEIFADDVKCTHGATIGQLNEDEIFYLQTRCISKKDAIKLLAHGFVEDIIERIHNEAIQEKLNVLLEPTFAALE